MLLYFIICIMVTTPINGQAIDIINLLDANPALINDADLYLTEDKLQVQTTQIVDIKLYYEAFCPGCRNFDTMYLAPTVKKLSQYLDVHVYPYGNAKITISAPYLSLNAREPLTMANNGKYKFICQHGPEECYGNKLHACAIDQLGNITEAITFNSCMMDLSQANRGSDDAAADKCGTTLNVNSEPIKQCAKGPKGDELLKYYGEESKKIHYNYVPYILVNGVVNNGENFMRDVCAAFSDPPPPCSQL